jgi:tRNA A-37 threonylcarbamoyl transferase component Bud32
VSGLNHPSVSTIYEIGEYDGCRFIAMEFVDGMNLRQRIAESSLDLGTAMSLAIEIADALDAAHTAGVIHRERRNVRVAGFTARWTGFVNTGRHFDTYRSVLTCFR